MTVILMQADCIKGTTPSDWVVDNDVREVKHVEREWMLRCIKMVPVTSDGW